MRAIGEISLSRIPSTKKTTSHFRAVTGKRDIEVKCHKCDYIAMFCAGALKEISEKNWLCRDCKKEAQKEFNKALINLAKRKGLIK